MCLRAAQSSQPAVQKGLPNASSYSLQADAAGEQQAAPAATCRQRDAAAAGWCQPHAAALQSATLTAHGAVQQTQSGGGARATAQPATAGIGHRGLDAAAAQRPSPLCRLPVAQHDLENRFAADLAAAEAADRKKRAQQTKRWVTLCVCLGQQSAHCRHYQHEPPIV
jgi:hypothetical protein